MRFHDFHLDGYTVSKSGGEIVLHLVWPYQDQVEPDSHLRFSNVAVYRFTHLGGAILTDIDEVSLGRLLDDVWPDLFERNHELGGLPFRAEDRATWQQNLEVEGFKAWTITSAVGFGGFVIARDVEEVAQ
jgi:hypothetical protein